MRRKPYYRIPEISEKSQVPKTTLYDAVRKGEIEALKLGAAVYISGREALRLLGHAKLATTADIYAHVSQDLIREAMDKTRRDDLGCQALAVKLDTRRW